jgi:demethylmenaquinone methyltransferase/2-methoxy-6-polyprenyl-1,4-benzoquinol methylase
MTSQDIGSTQQFYTRISQIYDALTDAGEHVAHKLAVKWLDARPGERILEVGFGTGTAMVPIARAVGRRGQIVGVDISEGMCRVASRRVRSARLAATVHLRVAAIPPIPADDRQFDAAYMAFTLELFPDEAIPMVLHEIRRVLRPDGRFVVIAMDKGDKGQKPGFAERAYRWLHEHCPNVIDCRAIDVVGLLTDAGLALIRVQTLDIWGLPVKVCLSIANNRANEPSR